MKACAVAWRAASVMLQPQSAIAVAMIHIAEAFWIAFLCIYPCKYDVLLLFFSLFLTKPHRVAQSLSPDDIAFLTRASIGFPRGAQCADCFLDCSVSHQSTFSAPGLLGVGTVMQ